MAHHRDALKRIKQSEKRRLVNKAVRTRYRNQIREVREAISAGDAKAAESALRAAISALDSAVSKDVIHRNTADRHKSRLCRAVAALKSSGQPA